ncbi:MAG TPA: (d)CMP kinase, partial [Holophaga sp.]|nr:(d)CMP kinase [Holophaga sp.]
REQQAKGIGALMTLEEVTADILRRDRADTTRAASPLRKAAGAVELDSSDLSLEQVVEWIVRHHQAHG